ncbi:MAG: signal peptide peptidase SppA [Phycisphaerales bacterium]|nr:signal peptide peptidase SppA [Phycisphaerales bacterium]
MSRHMMRMLLTVAIASCTQAATGEQKIAHFHLTGAMTETPQDNPFAGLSEASMSLHELLDRLADARKDDEVQAVALTFDSAAMGLGQIEELRAELRKFHAVNKRVFVHVDGLQMGSYALMSGASDLSVVPLADVWLTGLYSEGIYVKDLLEKIGVEAQILHCGDYKSAGELFTRTGPSEAAAKNMNWLLDGLYEGCVNMIAESRGLTAAQVQKLIDEGPYTAESAKKAGLVDQVQYRDEFLAEIKKVYGGMTIDSDYGDDDGMALDLGSNPFALFSKLTEMFSPVAAPAEPSIGIVYVEGNIVPGHGQPSPFGGASGAFSGDIAKALEDAADDASIKAVVLRVDSPGGSATASDIIWRATQRVKARKPLIVSMGNVAGSGGYYVACGADEILADETTITGSIGVVGGKMITTEMWTKLGVNWVGYARGKNADLMTSARAWPEDQQSRIQDWMNDVYGEFKERVTEGRQSKLTKPLDEMAGGRVFSGKQALELGLVDRIGGLSDAIELAAKKASISTYEVRVLPKPKNLVEAVMAELTGQGERPTDLHLRERVAMEFGGGRSAWEALLPMLERVEPQRARLLMQALKRIELLSRESVLVMMPMDFLVR